MKIGLIYWDHRISLPVQLCTMDNQTRNHINHRLVITFILIISHMQAHNKPIATYRELQETSQFTSSFYICFPRLLDLDVWPKHLPFHNSQSLASSTHKPKPLRPTLKKSIPSSIYHTSFAPTSNIWHLYIKS